MSKIKVAIIGVGNCASSLVQGIHFYGMHDSADAVGLMHHKIGGNGAGDIEVVAAFDIDSRKVGHDLSRAIFAPPNCTKVFCEEVPKAGVVVTMGRILDGVSQHMLEQPKERTFLVSDAPEPDADEVVRVLRESGAEMLLNYLPVGSQEATEFYAECALEAEIGLINNIPVFIASNNDWSSRFEERNLPLIGDDIKAQLGATILHRTLAQLFEARGVELQRTYQLNTGGNTDFLNMLNRDRLNSKKASKTEAVQSMANKNLQPEDIHIGPSDYVAWQNDNKVCFIRMEGQLFGSLPVDIEVRLSVEDSPNSAGVAIDAIRCVKIALERGQGGVLRGPSAYFCKRPPEQIGDHLARQLTDEFIEGNADNGK